MFETPGQKLSPLENQHEDGVQCFLQLAEELLEDYAPTPLIGALTRIPGYAISIFAIGWFWGLLDVNGWEKFHWSASSGLVWGAFTIPYFLFTFLFWNGFVFNDVKPVRVG